MLGWMSADGVFTGDVAALVFGTNEQPTAESMAEELNLMLPRLSDGEDTVKDIERDLLGTAAGRRGQGRPVRGRRRCPTAVSTGSRAHVSVAAGGGIRVSTESSALVRMLEDRYGLRVAASAVQKDVPTELHRVADDLKVAYLQGLFSADATIRTAAGGGSGRR